MEAVSDSEVARSSSCSSADFAALATVVLSHCRKSTSGPSEFNEQGFRMHVQFMHLKTYGIPAQPLTDMHAGVGSVSQSVLTTVSRRLCGTHNFLKTV